MAAAPARLNYKNFTKSLGLLIPTHPQLRADFFWRRPQVQQKGYKPYYSIPIILVRIKVRTGFCGQKRRMWPNKSARSVWRVNGLRLQRLSPFLAGTDSTVTELNHFSSGCDIVPVVLSKAQLEMHSQEGSCMLWRIFTFYRTWGPIYGSRCHKQTNKMMFGWLNWCVSGWWRYWLNSSWWCH